MSQTSDSLLRVNNEILCKLVEATNRASDCSAPTFVDVCANSALSGKLDEIIDLLTQEVEQKYDWEFSCSDVGLVKLRIDTSTGVQTIFNLDGTINTTAVLESCDSRLESDPVEICILGVAGIMWIVKKDGIPTGDVYYTDKFGQVINAPAVYEVGKCVEPCVPEIWSGTADDLSNIIDFHSGLFIKPECCTVTIETSVGNIVIPKNITLYSTSIFECPISINNITITGNASLCSLDKVSIILNKIR